MRKSLEKSTNTEIDNLPECGVIQTVKSQFDQLYLMTETNCCVKQFKHGSAQQ